MNGSWGILAGLVSITAGCGSMECGSACFTGFMGALVYQGPSETKNKWRHSDLCHCNVPPPKPCDLPRLVKRCIMHRDHCSCLEVMLDLSRKPPSMLKMIKVHQSQTEAIQHGHIWPHILPNIYSELMCCSVLGVIWCLVLAVFGARTGASMLLQKMHVDDPVDASPVHGFCGIWGLLAASNLAKLSTHEACRAFLCWHVMLVDWLMLLISNDASSI